MSPSEKVLLVLALAVVVWFVLGYFLFKELDKERAYYAAHGIDIDERPWPSPLPEGLEETEAAAPAVFRSGRYSGNSHQRRVQRRAERRGAL